MKIKGLDHIHFIVTDLKESLDFYAKLGLVADEAAPHHSDSVSLTTSPQGIVFEIQVPKPTENPGFNHLALVVEDLEAAIDELRERDVNVDGPINAPTGRRIANLRDPSGFLLQLVEAQRK